MDRIFCPINGLQPSISMLQSISAPECLEWNVQRDLETRIICYSRPQIISILQRIQLLRLCFQIALLSQADLNAEHLNVTVAERVNACRAYDCIWNEASTRYLFSFYTSDDQLKFCEGLPNYVTTLGMRWKLRSTDCTIHRNMLD